MQKCFLVSNRSTQVREYLENRSIIEVVEEYKTLSELDLERLGIVDVDKFVYIYYGADDADWVFRSDLNMLRQLLRSAFFHVDEGIFILVDCQNPMLEDFIYAACKDSNLTKEKLDIHHHKGALMLNDVSTYIIGSAFGTQTSSSYKTVYIKEKEEEERERFANVSQGVDSILPILTDQYSMYKKRAEVEAIRSSRFVTDIYERPQKIRGFAEHKEATIKQWRAFILSGKEFTGFEFGAAYLTEYLSKVGERCLIIDLSDCNVGSTITAPIKVLGLSDIRVTTSFAEYVGLLKCEYFQLGYVMELLDNVESADVLLFVCDWDEYMGLIRYITPICEELYCDFVTHYLEEAVLWFLREGIEATTLFLSTASIVREFDIYKYRDSFKNTRVALFTVDDIDSTDFFECAVGGV